MNEVGASFDILLNRVMSNDATEELLIENSDHESYVIRYWVTQNANTPVEILVKLVKDPKSIVRQGVIRSPRLPSPSLFELMNDEHFEVARDAKERLKELDILDELLEQ